jgi:beta-lactamase class A
MHRPLLRSRPLHVLLTIGTIALTAALPLAAQTTSPADDAGLQRLGREIARLAEHGGGVVGVAALHLETNRWVFLNGEERFPMASTYKVPIAVQLLSRVDRGEIALSDMIELEPVDLHPGSGTLTSLFDDPGVILSVHNLLELMLLISDNSATDLSLRAAGGPEAVNVKMAQLGIDRLSVDRPTSLLIADFVGVHVAPEDGRLSMEEFQRLARDLNPAAREAAARAFSTDERDTSTPHAMARLLESIWHREAVGPESTELLLDILRRVETGAGRIKGLLPRNTVVAHKTGTIGGTTNDVGIIYLPDDTGHVVTVVFVKDSELNAERREAAIAQIARAIYDYFLFNPGS